MMTDTLFETVLYLLFFYYYFNRTTQKYLNRAGQNLNNYSGIQRILCQIL